MPFDREDLFKQFGQSADDTAEPDTGEETTDVVDESTEETEVEPTAETEVEVSVDEEEVPTTEDNEEEAEAEETEAKEDPADPEVPEELKLVPRDELPDEIKPYYDEFRRGSQAKFAEYNIMYKPAKENLDTLSQILSEEEPFESPSQGGAAAIQHVLDLYSDPDVASSYWYDTTRALLEMRQTNPNGYDALSDEIKGVIEFMVGAAQTGQASTTKDDAPEKTDGPASQADIDRIVETRVQQALSDYTKQQQTESEKQAEQNQLRDAYESVQKLEKFKALSPGQQTTVLEAGVREGNWLLHLDNIYADKVAADANAQAEYVRAKTKQPKLVSSSRSDGTPATRVPIADTPEKRLEALAAAMAGDID